MGWGGRGGRATPPSRYDDAVKRKPRIILVVLSCLLAGAIVNVAVAWTAAGLFGIPMSWRTALAEGNDTGIWNSVVPHDLLSKPIIASSASNWGVQFRCVVATPVPEHTTVTTDDDGIVTRINLRNIGGLPKTSFDHALFAFAGWPCVSMSGASWRDDDFGRICSAGEMLRQVPTDATRLVSATIFNRSTSGSSTEYRLIPLAPIWPGFAVNTVFYAFIVWMLFIVPFVLRRRRRIKRGLCPKCAYPVGTNQVCTECGTLLAPSPTAAVKALRE